MKPVIEEIKEEHRIIGRGLSSLENIAAALERGQRVPPELLRDELDFITGFADRCHHRKEETILFPALEGQLPLKHHDPVPQLLRDHDEGRRLVSVLAEAVERYTAGAENEGRNIAGLLENYRSLLIEHIRVENTLLAAMVEENLPADKKIEVAERFEAVEDELGPEYHKKYARLAERLHDEAKNLAA